VVDGHKFLIFFDVVFQPEKPFQGVVGEMKRPSTAQSPAPRRYGYDGARVKRG
jgi:hypothetical protein